MKKHKTMLSLLAVLAVLLAAYLSLNAYNRHQTAQKAAKAKAQTVYLTDRKKLTALRYTNGSTEMSFTLKGQTWVYDKDAGVPLQQAVLTGLSDTLKELSAVRRLTAPDDLADYGLTKPAYTIWYTTENGETPIYIGSATGDNYYATVGDTKTVYTIAGSLLESLKFDLKDLAALDTVPAIGSDTLKKVEITKAGKTTTYKDKDELAELTGGFGALALTDCVEYDLKADAAAAYGLDEAGRTTVTAAYTDSSTKQAQTYKVYVGKTDESGTYYYVQVQKSNIVYRVTKEVIDNLTAPK